MTKPIWLRAFFPRWNFFDRISNDVFLEYRSRTDESELWTRIDFESPRSRFGLFLNPHVSLRHAQQSLLENLVQVASESDQPPNARLTAADFKHLAELARCRGLESGRRASLPSQIRIGTELDGTATIIAEVSP